jgi:hypothetical protein
MDVSVREAAIAGAGNRTGRYEIKTTCRQLHKWLDTTEDRITASETGL